MSKPGRRIPSAKGPKAAKVALGEDIYTIGEYYVLSLTNCLMFDLLITVSLLDRERERFMYRLYLGKYSFIRFYSVATCVLST